MISFIFVLGVLVFVHELGHFLVAKKAGIRVEQFSLGYPPKAFGVTIGETEYCISWLPLGGYVKVSGMADFGHEEAKGEVWEFQSKPRWVQMSVMAAGPAMNFLLGFLLILGIRVAVGDYAFMNTTQIGRVVVESPFRTAGVQPGDVVAAVGGREVADWEELVGALLEARGSSVAVQIVRDGTTQAIEVYLDPSVQDFGINPFVPARAGTVMPGYPAEKSGILPGDLIVAVAGAPVASWWEMSERISARAEQEIDIRWLRDGVEFSARIAPQAEQVGGQTVGRIGIGMAMDRTPVGVGKAVRRSGEELVQYTTAIVRFVKRLVSGQASGRALAGPVAIAQMAGQSAQQGWEALLSFMALLSVNLALLNLLPIPMLDGGHLMILSVEMATRRQLSSRQKEVLQQVGFVFLLSLMVYVTFSDIGRIFGWFN